MRASWLQSSPKGEGDVNWKSGMLSGLNEKSYSLFYKDICLNISAQCLTQWLMIFNKGLLYTISHPEMEQPPLTKNASDIS